MRPVPAPIAAPMPALPAIAPMMPPAAAPPTVPTTAPFSLGLISAQAPSPNISPKTTKTVKILFIVFSDSSRRLFLARPLFGQKAKLRLHRQLFRILWVRLGPFDEHRDRLAPRRPFFRHA